LVPEEWSEHDGDPFLGGLKPVAADYAIRASSRGTD